MCGDAPETHDLGHINFVVDDGGRMAAGFKGLAGDCGARALAIATGVPYREVYDTINAVAASERRRTKRPSSARTGVHRDTMAVAILTLGALQPIPYTWTWTATMQIGQGCRVHLRRDELPREGRHILSLSKHYAAYVDGALHDLEDCSRDGKRCVYGYWTINREGE